MNQPLIKSETPEQLSNNDLAEDRTELAKYRSRAAADRTLMAWIRTCLSLIGFGFGIPTIVRAIENTRLSNHLNPVRFSVIVGLSFIVTGMLGMVLGLREHRQLLKQIQNNRYTYETSHSAEIIGVALLVIGLVSFIGVVIRAMNF
ncbi:MULTISPECIES: YidH family protein [unclassified Dolichospermum]|uniref:YidH family protein n=1 Tax=unclassified Dolichospermum TaxID=2622029 RepID=UPI001446F3ED|nr:MULTISPECIES: DUF202 domain-containing protein [unclassified Dolichospermum]MTJ18041.1 DUF202 domain-containing protein [Dolichospermum sp. UHCC 0299]MTJ37303.1 DUF202 domain-containing protein [Dolichospermum sp. UHCC 0406]